MAPTAGSECKTFEISFILFDSSVARWLMAQKRHAEGMLMVPDNFRVSTQIVPLKQSKGDRSYAY